MLEIQREAHPRLYSPVDDPEYRFAPPDDPVRKRILKNIVADCELYYRQRPWKQIPERSDSPHPYHQLYLTFYTGMHATALMENYAFAWRLTRDARWLKRARDWVNAAASWEHSDRVEEHFYTANRYMHAFALALDLLDGELEKKEKKQATDCLVRLLERWWPDVEKNRYSTDGNHHAVVDNGHFGVAALYLLGKHPMAEKWVAAVVDRFRSGVMPHGCGRDGEPGDGATFWPWENLWMLHFADALKNVTGVDLYREFPKRLVKPLTWFRYHLAAPEKIEDRLYYPGNSNVLLGTQLDGCSVSLLRLAQEAGDRELRDAALRDPRLGRLYRFGMGVKGSSAECMVSYGPYTYCYYDPDFDVKARKVSLPSSRTFTRAHYGETGLLRSSWETDAVIACVSGYKGGGAHGFTNLHVQWAGHPVLRTIAAEEAQPVQCGSLPCVGGQNEVVSFLKKLDCEKGFDRLFVEGIRTDQEYWLLKGDVPAVLAVARRRPRGVRRMTEGKQTFVRLDGKDSLQYERKSFFNPRAGELRMRFRLNAEMDGERPQVLFNTGIGVGRLMGTRVNTFSLGFWEKGKLTFCVNSQRNTSVSVSIPAKKMQVGKWHEVVARWGGFNRPGDQPFIEVGLDGKVERFDDQAVFGELGVDSQRLESRKEPRTFYIKSITELAFGGAVQMPNTGTACDLAEIELKCPGKKWLSADFAQDLGPEMGDGALSWKLNPTDLKEVKTGRAMLAAGKRALEVLPVCGEDVRFEQEEVPFAPSGLAAGSLKSFIAGTRDDSVRVRVSTDAGEVLALMFVEKRAKAKVVRGEKGFELQLGKVRYGFDVKDKGKAILSLK